MDEGMRIYYPNNISGWSCDLINLSSGVLSAVGNAQYSAAVAGEGIRFRFGGSGSCSRGDQPQEVPTCIGE